MVPFLAGRTMRSQIPSCIYDTLGIGMTHIHPGFPAGSLKARACANACNGTSGTWSIESIHACTLHTVHEVATQVTLKSLRWHIETDLDPTERIRPIRMRGACLLENA